MQRKWRFFRSSQRPLRLARRWRTKEETIKSSSRSKAASRRQPVNVLQRDERERHPKLQPDTGAQGVEQVLACASGVPGLLRQQPAHQKPPGSNATNDQAASVRKSRDAGLNRMRATPAATRSATGRSVEEASPDNNEFIVVTKQKRIKYIKTTPVNTISSYDILSEKFTKKLSEYDFIVLHTLNDMNKKIVLNSFWYMDICFFF